MNVAGARVRTRPCLSLCERYAKSRDRCDKRLTERCGEKQRFYGDIDLRNGCQRIEGGDRLAEITSYRDSKFA